MLLFTSSRGPSPSFVCLSPSVNLSELGGSMYDNISGKGGAVSIIGGVAVLPNTAAGTPLNILSIVTIVTGVIVVLSFIVTRALAYYYR